jgi:predicted nucleic acid-binding protein
MTAFDTNVLIHSCDRSDPHRQRRAFELIEESTDGVLLWQVAIEFVAASRKLASQGFAPGDAWARLREFMDVFHLVLPSPRVLSYAQPLHQHKAFRFGMRWSSPPVSIAVCKGSIQRIFRAGRFEPDLKS